MNDTIKLITTRSDSEIADDLKCRLNIASAPLKLLINEANENKFTVNMSFDRDSFGQLIIHFILLREF